MCPSVGLKHQSCAQRFPGKLRPECVKQVLKTPTCELFMPDSPRTLHADESVMLKMFISLLRLRCSGCLWAHGDLLLYFIHVHHRDDEAASLDSAWPWACARLLCLSPRERVSPGFTLQQCWSVGGLSDVAGWSL